MKRTALAALVTLVASSCTILGMPINTPEAPIMDQGITFQTYNDNNQLCAIDLMVWSEFGAGVGGNAHVGVGPKDRIAANDNGCAQYAVVWFHADQLATGTQWATMQSDLFGPFVGAGASTLYEAATAPSDPRRIAINAQLGVQVNFGEPYTVCNLYAENDPADDPEGLCPDPLTVTGH